jgi:hypothetical protein
MSNDIRSLAKEHHAFYEVSPYYVVRGDGSGSPSSVTRTIQAGFDIDVYGVNTNNTVEVPPPADYELAYLELQKMADEVCRHIQDGSCILDIVSFPSTAFFDVQHQGKVEAMIRIRISHCGDLDQSAGLPEQHALQKVEEQLNSLGIARR